MRNLLALEARLGYAGWHGDAVFAATSSAPALSVLRQFSKRYYTFSPRIKRKIYSSRELARQGIFDYIEMFYNPIRRHGYAANLSPVNYERQYFSEATNCL
ncbi:hypothetical protein PuT2_12740 [Pusillimonas sp. T2]|nr:hypothetical protein PuT2_12740 [Pusillimonas sp. T2]